jgi:hypothetical protein
MTTSKLLVQQANGSFQDQTQAAGITDQGYAMGVAVGDLNNDGRNEVYLTNVGGDKLLANLGKGIFKDITGAAGIKSTALSTSAAFLDFDRDGRLDLFVCQYTADPRAIRCQVPSGKQDYCHPRYYPGTADRLLRNVTPTGAGAEAIRFEDVSEPMGIAKEAARGLGVLVTDINLDGYPDIFVANDIHANHFWVNQTGQSFKQLADPLGTSVDGAGRLQGSMGVAETDLDDDGHLDLIVTNFFAEYTTLYCRRNHAFADVSNAWGATRLTRNVTGFGITAIDVDADGTDELVQINGRVIQHHLNPFVPPPKQPNDVQGIEKFWQAYREPGLLLAVKNHRLEDITQQGGDFAGWNGVGRGLAVGDLDGDGLPEIIAVQLAGPAEVFQLPKPTTHHWLALRTIDGAKGKRDALGATIKIHTGKRTLLRHLRASASFLTSHQPMVFVGLGPQATIDAVEVIWPDGDPSPEFFRNIRVDAVNILERGRGAK